MEDNDIARLLHESHRRGDLLDASTVGVTTMDHAYRIQDSLTARRLATGGERCGWKLGYTSIAMRKQMGVDRPNFGPLLGPMLLDNGADLADRATQPRVEPEIGVRFASPLTGSVTRNDVAAAIGSVHACLEVVDSIWRDYKFTIEHNTADGSSAAFVVIGPELVGPRSLDEIEVVLSHNSRELHEATGAAASGHPLDGVVWLVNELADRGMRVEAGDLVITGGLTAAPALQPGDRVSASFNAGATNTVEVSVCRAGSRNG